MASRNINRALKFPVSRQLVSPIAQRRTFVYALSNSRGALAAQLRPAVTAPLNQIRGLKQIDFAGHKETVYGELQLKSM